MVYNDERRICNILDKIDRDYCDENKFNSTINIFLGNIIMKLSYCDVIEKHMSREISFIQT